ncbi:15213_t:CDS:2, partial [Dentiscutata heterogama]
EEFGIYQIIDSASKYSSKAKSAKAFYNDKDSIDSSEASIAK